MSDIKYGRPPILFSNVKIITTILYLFSLNSVFFLFIFTTFGKRFRVYNNTFNMVLNDLTKTICLRKFEVSVGKNQFVKY